MRKLVIALFASSLLVATIGGPSVAASGRGRDPNGKVCLVADQDGFVGIAADARAGLERADRRIGVATAARAARTEADIPAIVESFVESGRCDLIIGVGFIVGFAMEPFVAANPHQRFAVVDLAYANRYDNVAEILFQVDEAAFLAGYVAARISDTDKVGVYGGANIVPVTLFMDGYALGVHYHNQRNGDDVEVLGWDPETRSGILLDFEFDNPELGRSVAEGLFDQGADTVFPVAGRTSLGSLDAAIDRKRAGHDVRVIGPDFDWFRRYGDPARVVLTSVVKQAGVAVYHNIEALVDGTWQAGPIWEDLASDGVDIAPFHRTNRQVPGPVRRELRVIRSGIIDGSIPTLPSLDGAACLVTGEGGIDDGGFNENAWQGAVDAATQLGVAARVLESTSPADYRTNIEAFVEADCGVIVTVGFALAEATGDAARAHPDQDFAIVDSEVADFPGSPWCLSDPLPDGTCGGALVANVRGSSFRTDESSFLAGYLAAGMSQTGGVGTFGALPFPSVTTFMDGFVWGVDHYNSVKGTTVDAIGWDPDTRDGLFTGSFGDISLGRTFAQDLVDRGADIVFPVAGAVGLGSASLCQETGSCIMIGVDVDQFVSAPEFGDVWLTSVEKAVDRFVFTTVESEVLLGEPGPAYVGTLANDGTGLAPYHEFAEAVPQQLQDEIVQLRLDVISGVIVPGV